MTGWPCGEHDYGDELARRFAAWADGAHLLEESTEEQVALLAKAYIAGAMQELAARRWTSSKPEYLSQTP